MHVSVSWDPNYELSVRGDNTSMNIHVSQGQLNALFSRDAHPVNSSLRIRSKMDTTTLFNSEIFLQDQIATAHVGTFFQFLVESVFASKLVLLPLFLGLWWGLGVEATSKRHMLGSQSILLLLVTFLKLEQSRVRWCQPALLESKNPQQIEVAW